MKVFRNRDAQFPIGIDFENNVRVRKFTIKAAKELKDELDKIISNVDRKECKCESRISLGETHTKDGRMKQPRIPAKKTQMLNMIHDLTDILDEIVHGYDSPSKDFTLVRNGIQRYKNLRDKT